MAKVGCAKYADAHPPPTGSGLPKFDYSPRPGRADWALSDLKIQSADQMVKPDLRGFYARVLNPDTFAFL